MFDTKEKVIIVEVEKGSRLPELTNELKEMLSTLQHNPAFHYLLQRFRFQRARIQTMLNEGYKLDEKDLRYLQAGIFWLGFLETDINTLTRASTSLQRDPLDQELEEFQKIRANYDLVGQQ